MAPATGRKCLDPPSGRWYVRGKAVRITKFAELSAWTGEPQEQLRAQEDYHDKDRDHWLAWDGDPGRRRTEAAARSGMDRCSRGVLGGRGQRLPPRMGQQGGSGQVRAGWVLGQPGAVGC